jgi:hypothetical protein
LGSVLGDKRIIQNPPGDPLTILLAADLSTPVGSFVVDPGYTPDHYQGLRSVANRTPSLFFATLLPDASLNSF